MIFRPELIYIALSIFFLQPVFSNTVYFSIRADGHEGTGSVSDPYDGSTLASSPSHRGFISRYDARMHELTSTQNAQSLEIILGPGVYLTQGDYNESDTAVAAKGYLLQPNTTLRGAGRGTTTIKYMGWGPSGQIHSVICAGKYGEKDYRSVDYPNITIENLTVDCNASGLGLDPKALNADGTHRDAGACIYGIALAGSNCTVQNVEVIGPFGMTDDNFEDVNGVGFESFAISISAVNQNAVNLLVQNCIVRNAIGNYVDGITFGGSLDGKHHASGIISGNVVRDGIYVAYGVSGAEDAAISDNIALNCRFGFRSDTATLKNVTLSGNTFWVSQAAFALKSSTPSGFVADHISIIGNNFSAIGKPDGGEQSEGVIDLVSNAPITNFVVQGNVISSSNPSYPSLHLGAASSYSGILFRANVTSLKVAKPKNVNISTVPTPQTID